MYCTSCGKQLPENSSFCAYCGAVLTIGGNSGNSDMNLKAKRPLPKWLIPVIAGAAILVVVIIVAAWPRVKDNYVSAVYTGIESLLETSTGDMTLRVDSDDERFDASASWILGNNNEESAFDIDFPNGIYLDGLHVRRIGLNGYVADGYFDDEFRWNKISIRDFLIPYFGKYYDLYDVESIISDGEIDPAVIYEILDNEFRNQFRVGFDTEDTLSVIHDFLYSKCNEKGVTDEFLSDAETIRSGGITTYSYVLNVRDFINTFEDYISDIRRDSDYLKSKGIRSDTLETIDMGISAAQSYLSYDNYFPREFEISVSLDGKRMLHKLDVAFEVNGHTTNITLALTKYGSSEIDLEELEGIMDDAEEY